MNLPYLEMVRVGGMCQGFCSFLCTITLLDNLACTFVGGMMYIGNWSQFWFFSKSILCTIINVYIYIIYILVDAFLEVSLLSIMYLGFRIVWVFLLIFCNNIFRICFITYLCFQLCNNCKWETKASLKIS